MNVNTPLEPDNTDIPQPVIRSREHHISIVWIIPVIAALVGCWLIYKTFSERGPQVTITFKTAEGLEAGKTKIRYKDVEVGQVTDLSLSKDFSEVVVKAQFVKGAEAYLFKNTRFWVVRARIAVQGVSGLGTLFSGAYIDMDPGKSGDPERNFKGLEEPPIVTTVDPGRVFTLKAERKGSIEIGSPVYYRQITVGKVIAYNLVPDGSGILFKIFVNAPYDEYVRQNTRFWNASGFDMKLDAQGFHLQTESLVSLVVGGIAFDVVDNFEAPGETAPEDTVFTLFANRDAAQKKDYPEKKLFILNFNTSVRGLSPGAPVEFRGIQIGEVMDLKLEYDSTRKSFGIPVLIMIEPGRISLKKGSGQHSFKNIISYLIAKGLCAQLQTGNIVTGQQFVALDFFPDVPRTPVSYSGAYPTIPTLPTQIEELGTKINHVVDKLDRLPIDQIGKDLRDMIHSAKGIVGSPELLKSLRAIGPAVNELQMLISGLRTNTTPEINAVLKQARLSLAASQAVLEKDSPLQYRMGDVLQELSDAARSLRVLADYLESHPESILTGKGKEK